MIYPWQQTQWQAITKQHAEKHLHHAYLFTGMNGLGQFAFAEHMAAWLLCKKPDANGACGHCADCRLLSSKSHPDYFLLQPADGKKSISVAVLRDLTAKIEQTASQGGYQIIIIEPAESMTLAAANALLKTLEEPMGNVVFVLVSYEVGRLPITVQSRCQALAFTADTTAVTWLAQHLDAVDAELALKLANDAPLKAIEQQQSGFYELRQLVWQQILAVIERQTTWQAATKAIKQTNWLPVIQIMQSLVTDLLKCNLNLSLMHYANTDLWQQLSSLNLPQSRLLELYKQLEQLRQLLQRGAGVNAELQLLNIWRLWLG